MSEFPIDPDKRVSPEKSRNNENITSLSIDSLDISLYGDVVDIVVKFRGDSNVVTLCQINNIYHTHLPTSEHNLILESVDSLYISKTSKAIDKEIKVNYSRQVFSAPFLAVTLYKNGVETGFSEYAMIYDGTITNLFSHPFFDIYETLWDRYQLEVFGEIKPKIFSSPKELLMNSMNVDNVPQSVINKVLLEL